MLVDTSNIGLHDVIRTANTNVDMHRLVAVSHMLKNRKWDFHEKEQSSLPPPSLSLLLPFSIHFPLLFF